MKKLTVGIAVLLSGYAANSLAALPTGTSSRCDVTVPSFCGGFTFGLTGLYWRPSTPHLDYALTFPALDADDDFLFTDGRYHTVDHDHDWGFKANIGYVFPCSGNDVNLTYTHWDNDEHHHVRDFAFAFPTLATPFFPDGFLEVPFIFPGGLVLTGTATVDGVVGPLAFAIPVLEPGTVLTIPADAIDLDEISARSRFENRTWDLDFGQTINIGCNFRLRWFGGLRYSRLEHELDVTHDFATAGTLILDTFTAPTVTLFVGGVPTELAVDVSVTPILDFAATIREVVNQKSDFDGIGPRFGFDASYHVGGGFGFVGSLSTSLLVGEIESTFTERFEAFGTIFDATDSIVVFPATTTTEEAILGAAVTGPTGVVAGPAAPVEILSYRHPDETRVVPNIDAKLGIDWTYQFCNCSRSKVTVEAGYMVSHYFNAIDRLSEAGVSFPEFRTRHTIDASFDGPYIGVQVNL